MVDLIERCGTCGSSDPKTRACAGGLRAYCPHGHDDCQDDFHNQYRPPIQPVLTFWDGQKWRFCPKCQSMAFEFAEAYAKHCAALGRAEGLEEAAKVADTLPPQGTTIARQIRELKRTL